jgi:Ulp1 family protease
MQFDNVSRWTKRGAGKVDVFSLDILFIPINVSNMHWCLCVAYPQEKCIEFFDSLGGPGTECLEHVLQWVSQENVFQYIFVRY